jgi:hypothetical protein
LLLSGIDRTNVIKFPNDQGLLNDPNVWIADSAASMYMTQQVNGMINIQRNKANGITVCSGEFMVAKQRGDIPSELCDNEGHSIMKATIKDDVVNKNFPFNLFSLSKLMKQGWVLGGDEMKGITLTKEQYALRFDIPIDTLEGIVFAMYARRTEAGSEAVSLTMNIEEAHRLLGHQVEEGMETPMYLDGDCAAANTNEIVEVQENNQVNDDESDSIEEVQVIVESESKEDEINLEKP